MTESTLIILLFVLLAVALSIIAYLSYINSDLAKKLFDSLPVDKAKEFLDSRRDFVQRTPTKVDDVALSIADKLTEEVEKIQQKQDK